MDGGLVAFGGRYDVCEGCERRPGLLHRLRGLDPVPRSGQTRAWKCPYCGHRNVSRRVKASRGSLH